MWHDRSMLIDKSSTSYSVSYNAARRDQYRSPHFRQLFRKKCKFFKLIFPTKSLLESEKILYFKVPLKMPTYFCHEFIFEVALGANFWPVYTTASLQMLLWCHKERKQQTLALIVCSKSFHKLLLYCILIGHMTKQMCHVHQKYLMKRYQSGASARFIRHTHRPTSDDYGSFYDVKTSIIMSWKLQRQHRDWTILAIDS